MKSIKHLIQLEDGWTRIKAILLIFMLGMNSLFLSACVNNDNAQEDSASTGLAIIGLTDAEGDFVHYSVDVVSLTLTKANGAVVETLPLSSTVDFAQYVDMTEFLTAATVPNGAYTKATLTLDYRNAVIDVEDSSGNTVHVSSIVDSEGNPISTLDVSVTLENRNKLIVAPGLPSHMTLDFDLKSSNKVSSDSHGNVTVTVDPILVADVQLNQQKLHQLRGALLSETVDTSAGQFKVAVVPFHRALLKQNHRFGILPVTVNDATLYDIDGQRYQGQAGLEALAIVADLSGTIVKGNISLSPRRFVATEVAVGTAVPGGSLDVVSGNIVARTDNSITVRGATLIRSGGVVVLRDQVTVQLSDNTVIRKQGALEEMSIASLSVGQRVAVFGVMDSQDESKMDASSGRVLMQYTSLNGSAKSTATLANGNTELTMSIQRIDGRPVSLFNFVGTGSSADKDADPTNYQVDAQTLSLAAITTGVPVRVQGFVNAYGTAPEDFTAQTVTSLVHVRSVMNINWNPANADAFSAISSESLVLNTDGVGKFHFISRAGNRMDVSNGTSILPEAGKIGVFALQEKRSTKLYFDFEKYSVALQAALNNGAQVLGVQAVGVYNDSSVQLQADRILIKVK